MHSVLNEICTALDEATEKAMSSLNFKNTMRDHWGWHFPPLMKDDLVNLPKELAERIRSADISAPLSENEIENLKTVPARIRAMLPEIIPNMPGNYPAVYAYTTGMAQIEKLLASAFGLVRVDDPKLYPVATARRIKNVKRWLEEIDSEKDELAARVLEINRAYEAAEALPTTLQELDDARAALAEIQAKIEQIQENATKSFGLIESSQLQVNIQTEAVARKAEEANKLVSQCEDAYQITTTKGLAGAFDQRASRLNISIILWVIGLLVALKIGADIGSKRIEELSSVLSGHELHWGVIAMHTILSILSIGGPLWFAWLSTKQIGQRFRLAEDYAFKASVAKAYEGYRKQAASFNNEFSERLFGSALTRLEEAPLRLVEKDAHGSPWHELISSNGFEKAMETVPEFREKVLELGKKGLDTIAAFAPSAKSTKASSGKTEEAKDAA